MPELVCNLLQTNNSRAIARLLTSCLQPKSDFVIKITWQLSMSLFNQVNMYVIVQKFQLTHASLHRRLVQLGIRICTREMFLHVHHRHIHRNFGNYQGLGYSSFLFQSKQRIQRLFLHELVENHPSSPIAKYQKIVLVQNFLPRIISILPILPNLREGRERIGIRSSFLQQSQKTAVNNLMSSTYKGIRAKTMIKL